MMAFSGIYLCNIPSDADAPQPVPPVRSEVAKAGQVFRKLLLDADGIMETSFTLENQDPVRVIWIPAGQTAGVAIWARGEQAIAASILTSGLDKMDDAKAITLLLQSPRFRFSEKSWSYVVQARPPLLANLYEDQSVMNDRVVTAGSVGLAAAMFSLLGISRSPDEQDLPIELS